MAGRLAVPDPLRVALVMGPVTPGLGRHVQALVAGLVERGMRADVYCSAAAAEQYHLAEAGARVTEADLSDSPGPRDVAVVSRLRRGLRAEPVSIVHAHGLRAGFLAGIARPAAIPLVVSWHQTFAPPTLARLADRGVATTVAGSAEVSLCASAELVATAHRLGARDARLCPVPARVLPGPTRSGTEVRAELGLAAGTPLLLSVGRLDTNEHHEVLVSAAGRWRYLRPTPTAIIAGTGPAYRKLAAQILTTRAPVILAGHRDDLADLVRAADLAVVTSDGEVRQGFVLEALAAGVAVVAARQGGLPEVVGDAGILVPPGDVDALDAAVRSLLDHDERRARYVAAGIRRAGQAPTQLGAVEQVIATYREVAGRAGQQSTLPG